MNKILISCYDIKHCVTTLIEVAKKKNFTYDD